MCLNTQQQSPSLKRNSPRPRPDRGRLLPLPPPYFTRYLAGDPAPAGSLFRGRFLPGLTERGREGEK